MMNCSFKKIISRFTDNEISRKVAESVFHQHHAKIIWHFAAGEAARKCGTESSWLLIRLGCPTLLGGNRDDSPLGSTVN